MHEDPGSCESLGSGYVADDGITRPVVEADVRAADGGLQRERIPDRLPAPIRTVFSETLAEKTRLRRDPAPADRFEGSRRRIRFVAGQTVIELPSDVVGWPICVASSRPSPIPRRPT